jgi:phage protein D
VGVLDKVPILYVAIDGRTAPADLTRRVLTWEVDEHTKKASKITLALDDPDGRIRNGEVLREGQTIGLRWGYVASQLSRPRGAVVHKLHPSYAEDTVSVEAYGRELALSVGPLRRTFRGRSFRQAVEGVARDAGVAVRWEAAAGITFDAQVIDNEHAWAWILRKTAELGLEVDHDGETLTIREPRLGERAVTVLHYNWRNAEILSFEPETNGKKKERHDDGVVALFFDPASGQTLQHAAGDPNTTRQTLAARRVAARAAELARQRADAQQDAAEHATDAAAGAPATPTEDDPALLNLGAANAEGPEDPGALDRQLAALEQQQSLAAATTPAPSPERAQVQPVVTAADLASARQHLRQLAEGQFRQHERKRVKAKCVIEGNPSLRRGSLVQIVGVAPRDAGLWYVDGCVHKGEDFYTTELELKRDGVNGPRGRRPAPAAQPNPTPQAEPAPQTEPVVEVNLEDGTERL